MTNYEKLVETLRWTANEYKGSIMDEYDKDTMNAAADAIEELDAEETRLLLLTSDLQDKLMDLQAKVNRLELDNEDYEHENRRLHGEIEALQAEVKQAAKRNAELHAELERWVSAAEMAGEPKRGEWIEDATTYAGPGLSNYKCSLCGKICGTWRRGLKPSELPNWCGNCGADMRNMEVQDATN